MSYRFKISDKIENGYEYNYQLTEEKILNFNSKKYFNEYKLDGKTIICYGYCFDVNNPNSSIIETLKKLVSQNQIEKSIKYLNGHFIIIYLENECLSLYTDASSITPVYFSINSQKVCNKLEDTTDYIPLNPNYKLDLNNYKLSRFYTFTAYDETTTEKLEEKFVNLLKNQYKYFQDKNLNVIFQADNYHKALFAILSPILVNKNILVKKMDSKGFNKKFGEIFSNEFAMNYFESQEGENEYPLTNDFDFLTRNNLSNFKAIYTKKSNYIKTPLISEVYNTRVENEELLNYEFNLMDNYQISNGEYSNNFLIYEPLNVRELLNILINLNKREDFNSNLFMISALKPSLNFYNFTNGNTLREVNLDLKHENTELKSNSISSKNQKFLVNVKLSNFAVSQNLDGKVKKDEILIYPAKQKVKKGTLYTLEYKSDIEGLVYIEGFYKNENNSKRIIVTVNDEKFNIFDFYGGRYFYLNSKMELSIKYTQDYDSLSWQKASTLKIKVFK